MKKALITTVQLGDKKLYPLEMHEEAVHFWIDKPLEGFVPEH